MPCTSFSDKTNTLNSLDTVQSLEYMVTLLHNCIKPANRLPNCQYVLEVPLDFPCGDDNNIVKHKQYFNNLVNK